MTITDVLATLPAIANPLDGILPDFSIFGVEFTALWQKLVAGIWAVGIILAIVFIAIGVTQMAGASSSGNPAAYKDARTQAMWAGISLGALAALSIIVGAILALFG